MDNDCDSIIEIGSNDIDGDGVTICGGDCDDNDINNYPGNPEICDGQDNDCNGFDDFGNAGIGGSEFDYDGDGFLSCNDCDDNNPNVYPGASEICDGKDNDCNTFIDDGVPVFSSIDVITACNTYTWMDSVVYTTNNNSATITLTSTAGCDSIVTLDLTINTVDNGITNSSPTLSANASTGIYQWLDCDNNYAPINGEPNQIFIATANGNYAVAVTQNGCTDTSACESVNNVGINEISSNINVHPNPTNDLITLDVNGYNGSVNVEVYDLSGRLLKSTNNTTISLNNYAKGIYVFRVSYGDIVEELKVVKD